MLLRPLLIRPVLIRGSLTTMTHIPCESENLSNWYWNEGNWRRVTWLNHPDFRNLIEQRLNLPKCVKLPTPRLQYLSTHHPNIAKEKICILENVIDFQSKKFKKRYQVSEGHMRTSKVIFSIEDDWSSDMCIQITEIAILIIQKLEFNFCFSPLTLPNLRAKIWGGLIKG